MTTKNKSCKYYTPPTYATCAICELNSKYTSCYGDKNKCTRQDYFIKGVNNDIQSSSKTVCRRK